jgi:acyl-coenzyme A thioesterase PaaI-like protein
MAKVSMSVALMQKWRTLSRLPGGKRLFSYMLGRMAPYTGTVGAVVEELEPGYAKVTLRDRRKVRNHLNSIHAIALCNLGEVTTGVACLSGMPGDARGILKGLSIEYHKKARGLLTAECRCDIPRTSERCDYIVEGEIRNAAGELVSSVKATWLIGPRADTTKAPA